MGCGPCRPRPKDQGAPRQISGEVAQQDETIRQAEATLQAAARGGKSEALGPSESQSSSSSTGKCVDQEFPMLKVNSLNSLNSQLQYADRDQTIIIFDWDDTLCPSTWLRRNAMLDASGNVKANIDAATEAQLQILATKVNCLIETAHLLGKVVMVTNARRPWVDTSCANFLPWSKATIQPIPVMYALEIMRELDPAALEADGGCVLTETKARSMKACVSEFYSRYPNQSWKNIISIGDAFFEHNAIRQVAKARPDTSQAKKCRTKTVKLLERPSIAGMVVQLAIIWSWLEKIVQLDEDVDIDLAADEATVNKWVTQFGDSSASV